MDLFQPAIYPRGMSDHDPKLLLRLLNSLPEFISYVDVSLRYQFTNDANRAFFPEKEIIGLTMIEVMGSERFERVKPNVEKVLKGEIVCFELTMPNALGNRFVEGTYVPDFDEYGKVRGFFVNVKDITSRKQVELELFKSEENYKLIFDRNPLPIFIWETESMKFLEVNETMVAHYGYSRDEFLKMSILDVRPAEEVDVFMERYSTIMPGYRKESRLTIHRKKDGTLIKVMILSYDLVFRGLPSRIVLVNDVTERLRVEEERETLLTALRETLKARDEFLTMASHELKTPITSLTLNTDLKKLMIKRGEMNAPETEVQALELQSKQLHRINRLIDDMMDISRIRIGKLEMNMVDCDFVKVVEEAVAKLSPLLLQSLGEVNYEALETAMVSGDPFRLEQVVTNLLTNAAKYGNNRPVSISVTKTETEVLLAVTDLGRGISPLDQKRIFTRFERVVSGTDIAGLGLGLTIVKEIVEAHRGHISVFSEIGKGAKFQVELPLLLS